MASLPLTPVHQLNAQAERLRDRPALWHRRGGRWQATSWRQYAQRVRQLALGLLSLGFGPRRALLVVGSSREEWLVASLGAMAAGGVAVGVDPSSSPQWLQSVAAHCEATMALVEGPAMLARLGPALAGAPRLERTILMDPALQRTRGVVSFAEVLELGARGDDADFYSAIGSLKGDDVAQLVYGAGPEPRAVMLTHRNLSWTAAQLSLSYPAQEEDVLLSNGPLSRVAEQLGALLLPSLTGAQVYFGRGLESLVEDLVEVRPTILFGRPDLWEAIAAKAEAHIAGQAGPVQGLWARGRPVARRFHLEAQRHQPSTLGLQGQYSLARRLVLGPLKDRLGLDRGRLFVTTDVLRRELFELLASLDVVVAELHGQAEVTGVTSVSAPGAIRFGAQGRPMLGVEVRVAEDGEVLVRGDNVCAGYFKDERATEELMRGGWLHSGEQGVLDEDGFLSITAGRSPQP